MNDKSVCPFCGLPEKYTDDINKGTKYDCGTWVSAPGSMEGYSQDIACVTRQRDQLQARLRKAEELLRDWLDCCPKQALHDIYAQETKDFLNDK